MPLELASFFKPKLMTCVENFLDSQKLKEDSEPVEKPIIEKFAPGLNLPVQQNEGNVGQDLSGRCLLDKGRAGMTAEQILRCAILKQYRNLTNEELAFHLQDSQSFRAFAKMTMGQYPRSSTLQENIKAIPPRSWEAIHQAIVG